MGGGEETFHENSGIQAGTVVYLLGHITYCDDLNIGTAVLDMSKHITNFLIDVLVFVKNQYIVGPGDGFLLVVDLDAVLYASGNPMATQLTITESMIVGYLHISALDTGFGIQLQQLVVGKVKNELLGINTVT